MLGLKSPGRGSGDPPRRRATGLSRSSPFVLRSLRRKSLALGHSHPPGRVAVSFNTRVTGGKVAVSCLDLPLCREHFSHALGDGHFAPKWLFTGIPERLSPKKQHRRRIERNRPCVLQPGKSGAVLAVRLPIGRWFFVPGIRTSIVVRQQLGTFCSGYLLNQTEILGRIFYVSNVIV